MNRDDGEDMRMRAQTGSLLKEASASHHAAEVGSSSRSGITSFINYISEVKNWIVVRVYISKINLVACTMYLNLIGCIELVVHFQMNSIFY
jgi:hypothetical protein